MQAEEEDENRLIRRLRGELEVKARLICHCHNNTAILLMIFMNL